MIDMFYNSGEMLFEASFVSSTLLTHLFWLLVL